MEKWWTLEKSPAMPLLGVQTNAQTHFIPQELGCEMSRGAQAQGKEWYVYVCTHTGLQALARLELAGAHHQVAQSTSEGLSLLLLSMAPVVFGDRVSHHGPG